MATFQREKEGFVRVLDRTSSLCLLFLQNLYRLIADGESLKHAKCCIAIHCEETQTTCVMNMIR